MLHFTGKGLQRTKLCFNWGSQKMTHGSTGGLRNCKRGTKRGVLRPGGALTWKGGMGMSGGQDPLFTPLPLLFRSPVAAWFSSLDSTLSKNNKFWLLREKFVENLNNFQLCSLNLAQISVHKPTKCWKFSVPQTILSQKKSVLYTSISALHARHPYLNKSWVFPSLKGCPGNRVTDSYHVIACTGWLPGVSDISGTCWWWSYRFHEWLQVAIEINWKYLLFVVHTLPLYNS